MRFYEFPDDIMISVLTGWLDMVDIARLDSATCNHKQRTTFLELISAEDGRVVFTGSHDFNVTESDGIRLRNYCQWLRMRNLAVRKVCFPYRYPGAVFDDFITNILSPRVQELSFDGMGKNQFFNPKSRKPDRPIVTGLSAV